MCHGLPLSLWQNRETSMSISIRLSWCQDPLQCLTSAYVAATLYGRIHVLQYCHHALSVGDHQENSQGFMTAIACCRCTSCVTVTDAVLCRGHQRVSGSETPTPLMPLVLCIAKSTSPARLQWEPPMIIRMRSGLADGELDIMTCLLLRRGIAFFGVALFPGWRIVQEDCLMPACSGAIACCVPPFLPCLTHKKLPACCSLCCTYTLGMSCPGWQTCTMCMHVPEDKLYRSSVANLGIEP